MSHTHVVHLDDVLKHMDEARGLLAALRDEQVVIEADTVAKRREAAQQRAAVKTDLSYASHLLELAHVLVDNEHQAITRKAKGAEQKAS